MLNINRFDKETDMVEENKATTEGKLQIQLDPTLEYKYRDLFNLHVSAEEVVIELGNVQRGVQGQGRIKDVFVLSPANAIRLQQGLAQAIDGMQKKIKDLQEQAANNS